MLAGQRRQVHNRRICIPNSGINLLGNANKHSGNGAEVTLTVRETEDGQGVSSVYFAVSLDGLCVLVAEDNAPNMEIIQYMLEERGCIVAASANAFEEDVKRSLGAGMNAHVSKPIEMSALLAALASVL